MFKRTCKGLSSSELYRRKLIRKFPNIEYGVFHSILQSEEINDKETFRVPKYSCPKCFVPRDAGLCQTRISPFPRKMTFINSLRRREKLKRTSRKDKILLAAFRNKENILTTKCKVCHFEVINKLKIPLKETNEKVISHQKRKLHKNEEEKSISKPKKKKKKKEKEKNAGLIIPKHLDRKKPSVRERNRKDITVQTPSSSNKKSKANEKKICSKMMKNITFSSVNVNSFLVSKPRKKEISSPYNVLKLKHLLSTKASLEKDSKTDLSFFLNTLA